MIGWITLGGLLLVSIAITPWAWIPTAVLAYWKIGRHFYLKGSKWRQVHFPFMRRYAHAAGVVSGLSTQAGIEFQVEPALVQTLKSEYPQLSDDEIPLMIERAIDDGRSFACRPAFAAQLKRKNPRLTEAKLESGLDTIAESLAQADTGMKVRFVIFELIRRQHGEQAALDYLEALLNGQAT
jgi:hypothetical protein